MYLTPDEINAYDTRQNALRLTYGQQMARNEYGSTQAGLDKNLGDQALTQKWDRYRNQLPGGYQKRGLANSGIYQQGLQNYAQDRLMGFQGLQRTYDRQVGDINLGQQEQEGSYNFGLNSVDAERAARRATLASQIQGIS